MAMEVVAVNLVAVVVAAVASMIIGMVWYSPMLFGKAWMSMMGWTEKDVEKMKKAGMTMGYVLSFVGALIMAYVLAHILQFSGARTLVEGLQGAFWVWLGFVATLTLGAVTWEGKSWNWWLLMNGHHLLSMLVMGAVLVSMA